ncbi:hypothetical protein QEH56_07485 [Pelagicoccus enzymogenes]|uniref:tetratricopeptide repeat protein n=1 Tax=Pelagicoccus enzymogenes TaxID=2773457 RepID=UPI00280CD546|nr:tetratricopeptide repeat protein [Pelagicoccus enzymogenes]MDQ8197984.1 hypothetical protein [Pelagicoccus enzymogenes]
MRLRAGLLGMLAILSIGTEGADAADVESRIGTLADAQMADLLGKHDEEELTKYQRVLGQARKAIAQGEHRKAFGLLDEARKIEPHSAAAYIVYAKLHLAREEYASAERAAQHAVQVAPENAGAWFQQSKIQALKGETDLAVRAAREAVKYSVDPRWDYQKWLGELLLQSGKAEEAERRLAAAAASLSNALETLETGINLEESKREVVGIHEETELVTSIGGSVTERPVTRLEKQYKDAPEEWYQMQRLFTEQMGEVCFSRFDALLSLGRLEEAAGLLPQVFQRDADYRGGARYAFAVREFEEVLQGLEAAHGFWSNASDSELATYVVALASSVDEKRLERSGKRLRRAISRSDSPWLLALLHYMKSYAPELKTLPSRATELAGADQALLEFYRAQFHFAQGYEELAWPQLELAVASGLLEGFELKVATVQLGLRE